MDTGHLNRKVKSDLRSIMIGISTGFDNQFVARRPTLALLLG